MANDLEENLVVVHTKNLDDANIKKKRLLEWLIHGLVFLFICCISAGAGIAIYFGERTTEIALFKSEFDGTIHQLQSSVQTGLAQKFAASRLLNKIYAFNEWYGYGTTFGQHAPYFLLPGIQNYTIELMTLSDVRGSEWHPLLVDNTTRTTWESWTKQIIKTKDIPAAALHTINNTAYKLGCCIFNSPTTRVRVSGTIAGGDPRFQHWLFPLWQGGSLTPPSIGAIAVFLEPHSWPGTRFQTIEKILSEGYGGQGAFTDVVQLGADQYYRPSTNFYSVVYSLSPTPKVIGITNLFFSWDSLLQRALPQNLQRVDCVLTTKTTINTFAVDQGIVTIVGKGDVHESAMTSYGQSLVLDISIDNIGSPLAASAYAITVYPSSAYFNQYITKAPVQLGIVLAVAVFIFLSMVYLIRTYYVNQQEKKRSEKERLDKAQEEALRVSEDAKKVEMDRERERQLRQELQENIANSAHDIKSPTTALGLAVESLLDALDNNKPLTEAGRRRVVDTLYGMVHTISALTMIINRSVDASNSSHSSGRGFSPNHVPVDVEKIMDEIMAYSKWQADGTGIEVVCEPLPTDLPDEIMMDEKWLKDDLLCVASNAIKYSRVNQKTPAVLRVAIVPTPANGIAKPSNPQSVQFSVIDSGYPLPNEVLTNLFKRPMFSERMSIGGMGLGLFCLSEHMQALQGQYGARNRSDGCEGTEISFSFPLIIPQIDEDKFGMTELKQGKWHFSAPQNRRSSAANPLSHRSRNPSRTGTPSRNGTPRTHLTVGAEDPTLGTEIDLSNARFNVNRVQEVLGSLPILLVDDAISILKMTKRAIQNECANISFMEAKNGEEAFERVVESISSFELIITDIQMPVCNGFEFTRKVRQLEREKGLPPKLIIGISANDQQKIAEEAKESGMDGFMHKPFKLATLINVIEDIGNRRKQNALLGNLPTNPVALLKGKEIGDTSALEQDGTVPTAAVSMSLPPVVSELPPILSKSSDRKIDEITMNSVKVHAAN